MLIRKMYTSMLKSVQKEDGQKFFDELPGVDSIQCHIMCISDIVYNYCTIMFMLCRFVVCCQDTDLEYT
jgi:hypothetical protein